MITVHHLNNSRSQRVLWLLEELELPYEIVPYQRDPKTMMAPPTLRAVHPLGKSPVITDDGRTVAESGAILEYLVARYGNGRLAPEPGSDAQLRCTYWLHYAEASLMPLLFTKLVASRLAHPPVPSLLRPFGRVLGGALESKFLGPQLEAHYGYIEGELSGRSFFAGDALTAADIQMSFPLEAAHARGGLDGARYPRTVQLLDRLHARPAYQRALAKGGPLSLGFGG